MSHPKLHSIDFANVLASVCSHWRHVAIGIPDLWTYIDLSRRGGLYHASLWLERSHNRALEIRTGSETIYPGWRDQHTSILQHISRIRSLLLRGDRGYMQRWLSKWYSDGIPGTTLALYPAPETDSFDFPGPSAPSRTALNVLLDTVRVIYLHRTIITWDQVSFQNLSTLCLVELEQEMDENVLKIGTLCQILLASPQLQCLRLVRIYMDNAESLHGPKKAPLIRLEHLETLELSGFTEADASQLLSMIAPGGKSLAFSISCTVTPWSITNDVGHTLLSFLRSSNITAFYCGDNTVGYLLPEIVSALPNIEILCLDGQTIGAAFSNSVAPKTVAYDSDRTRWPKLHTFEANGCEFEDIIDFKRLLAVCPIQELRISVGCSTSVSIRDQRDHGSMNFEDWAGPGVAFSCDCRKWEIGYMPFQ